MDHSHRVEEHDTGNGPPQCSRCPPLTVRGCGSRPWGLLGGAGLGRNRMGQVLMLTVLLFACWQVTRAELVYHRRDHRDQGRHAQTNHPRRNNVRNYSDAVHYLQKYGYLEHCNRTSSSRSRRHLAGFLPDVSERAMIDCSDAVIADALRRLQKKFDLAPSGRLDKDTRQLMSKGRCGNSDISEAALPTRHRRDSDRNPDDVSDDAAVRSQDNQRALLRRSLGRRRRYVTEEDVWENVEESNPRDPRDTDDANEEEKDGDEGDEGHVLGTLATPQDYDPESSRRRRQQMLQEITYRLMREMAPLLHHPSPQMNRTDEEMALLLQARQLNRSRLLQQQRRRRRRRKRTIILHRADMSEGSAGDRATKFQLHENVPVRWRLLDDGISGKIPLADQRAILELSFRMWSEVIPLKFLEMNDLDINMVDVVIAFAKQAHMNCDKPFDGVGGELAHSWKGGDIHFDEDENYKRVDPSGSGINLLKVAVHEVGHVLGLLHNKKDSSIMYPIYITPAMYDEFELSWDDRKAVQNIYGVCKGTFDVVFDWLRKVKSGHDPHHRPRYIFNTYFFRSNRYWMYENRFNRTRFGDPLHISRGWTGIADPVDGYTQVISSSSGNEYNIETYFFVGDIYYKYNDETDQVEDGYPRKIASDFGAKSDSDTSIPNALDAVLFDNRDSLLYFFKGQWVWTYDPNQIGKNACCEGKHLFSELFPMEESSNSTSVRLTGDLDTVFYSYHFHTIFFFRGEDVYENAAYNDKTPGVNRLRHLGAWYQIWHDICDVE